MRAIYVDSLGHADKGMLLCLITENIPEKIGQGRNLLVDYKGEEIETVSKSSEFDVEDIDFIKRWTGIDKISKVTGEYQKIIKRW